MKNIPYSENWEPGTWCNSSDEDPLPFLFCPKCGIGLLCISSHYITDDGCVHNSVVCVDNCSFHDFVRLLDYKEKREKLYRSGRE